jgi:UDP-glucose 4-epimerase
MRVFVTGATGFIGKQVMSRLDDSVAYSGDILDRKQLTTEMKGCDAVIHLAAKFRLPKETLVYTVNVIGTANVVRAMHDNNIKKIVFTSSIGAVNRFNNAYDDSKLIAEKVLQDAGLEPIILRLSNLYGKGQEERLVWNIISGIKSGAIDIYGDGSQTRDLVYVDDVVDAIILALSASYTKPIEIGCGKSWSISETIKIISSVVGRKANVKYNDYKEYDGSTARNNDKDTQISTVDLTAAREILKYKPKYRLRKGLKAMLKK